MVISAIDDVAPRPWFERHPRRAIFVSVVLFVVVTAFRFGVGDAEDAIALLFVLPVALVAMGFGRRAGTLAGTAAVGLLALWAVVDSVELSALGWVSRITPMLLIGVLVGAASDRIRASERAERRAVELAVLQADAAEVNDSIVQHLSAAKWAIEAGDVDRGMAILDDTIVTGQRLVTRVLGADSIVTDELRRRPARRR